MEGNNVEAYLDNAATTRVLPSISEVVTKVMESDYGNPSSRHTRGFEAEQYIRDAKQKISTNLKCNPKEILFTSGGTESNNLALLGSAMAAKRRGRHIVSTVMEHASVHEPLFFLEENDFEVTYLPVDEMGHVSVKQLQESVRKDTILVSIMHVNNEVGSLQDIEALANAVHAKNPQTVVHVDAIQSYGKFRIFPGRMGIDLMSVSGHKFHGPKGIGFLYVREGIRLQPIIFGGGQQGGMRSGTENVPGIAGIAQAVCEMYTSHTEKVDRLYEYKDYFIEKLQTEIDGVFVNCAPSGRIKETAPHIVSASFDSVRAEVLLHALEEKQIYVSSGSACSSNHPGISGTLKAVGVKESLLDSTLRFSFSTQTTKEELDYTVEQLKELVPVLRRYQRS